ncbi:hypothetical protein ASPFODRAFT_469204 [Aspergillus luchuensis CBS 106.47]|uniref:Uncharacterized protein n=1 Tax=Aspergillus luchuensis (strain CBS 106.47) TaxID=1137211 RepID=A0A1M3SZS6_ASPLC|nr:hypothetical protein ASPFODRAFT_469204 [Aspergillus luchuensis CBS 106.47]
MILSCGPSWNLPSLSCPAPPSISENLLNAPPILRRRIWRSPLSRGQSISTWTTVSVASQLHFSSSQSSRSSPCVASHEWPVRNWVNKWARFWGSEPWRRRVRWAGRARSMRRRCPFSRDLLFLYAGSGSVVVSTPRPTSKYVGRSPSFLEVVGSIPIVCTTFTTTMEFVPQ